MYRTVNTRSWRGQALASKDQPGLTSKFCLVGGDVADSLQNQAAKFSATPRKVVRDIRGGHSVLAGEIRVRSSVVLYVIAFEHCEVCRFVAFDADAAQILERQ